MEPPPLVAGMHRPGPLVSGLARPLPPLMGYTYCHKCEQSETMLCADHLAQAYSGLDKARANLKQNRMARRADKKK